MAAQQSPGSTKARALSDVKRALKAIISYAENDDDVNLVHGSCYVMSLSKSEGLIWNTTTKELTVVELGHLHVTEVDMLDEDMFSKV